MRLLFGVVKIEDGNEIGTLVDDVAAAEEDEDDGRGGCRVLLLLLNRASASFADIGTVCIFINNFKINGTNFLFKV